VSETGLYTLADLSEYHAIYAFCDPCNRSVKLNPSRLAAMYGQRFSIAELKHRLTCRSCGERTREIRIVYSIPQKRD
jgi:hypothetical protein